MSRAIGTPLDQLQNIERAMERVALFPEPAVMEFHDELDWIESSMLGAVYGTANGAGELVSNFAPM